MLILEKLLKNLFTLYMDRFIKKLVSLIETHLDRLNENESIKHRHLKMKRSIQRTHRSYHHGDHGDRHRDHNSDHHTGHRRDHDRNHADRHIDHHSDHEDSHKYHINHRFGHHKDQCETIESCHRDHIIEKIQTVASHLQTKIAENTITKMSDYFTEDACGHLVPIMVRIKTGEQIIQIPKYTLVNHSNIDLKEMKCRFRTNAHNLGIDCPDNFGIETEVIFERNGSVDGYNRISELLIREYT
jgi:hypothetical protein